MPNCGIHDDRSTNWNAGADGDESKSAHSASVIANAIIDTAKAVVRISPSREPSRLGISISTIEPTIGVTMARVRSPVTPLPPQVVGEDRYHSHETRHRIGFDRAVLQQAQDDADAADEISGA